MPHCHWRILLPPKNIEIGSIILVTGHNRLSNHIGNLSLEVVEQYRGHHYTLYASQMVLPVARWHDMKEIHIKCEYDNYASRYIIERLGAALIE